MGAPLTTSIALLAAVGCAAPAAADNGGMAATSPAHATGVSCWRGCAELSAARPGSVVRIEGTDLGQVTRVVFLGRAGTADDQPTVPSKVRSRAVYVTVPAAAVSGRLALLDGDGTPSDPTPPLAIDPGPAPSADPGGAPGVDARVVSRRAFIDGMRPAGVTFLVAGSRPARVTVSLVRATDQAVVATWAPGTVAPGSTQSIRWNGVDVATHQAAVTGRYEFRIFTSDGSAQPAQAAPSPAPAAVRSFEFRDGEFPIRGPHRFGTGADRFGAPRNGHVHQGQDTFAACGTPLVAARGGVVKFQGFEAKAGNYLVIDGQATGVDYAYMHLRDPAIVRKGDRVRTGQAIGVVGETGDATACHLHFEEWSAPGWFSGGQPFDPLPDLRRWDRFS